jgi:hypothetical protein
MRRPVGRNIPLSLPRRFICDLVHFAHQVPTVPVQRRMQLACVSAARRQCHERPSWCAVFTKAYAVVAARRPELRRAYLSFPRPHLYEHFGNVASIAVERRVKAEDAVLFAHVRSPETLSLGELHRQLRSFKQDPIETVGSFRHALRMSGLPRPLRRLGWWFALNCWGRKRAHYMGTYGISVYAGLGAASLHPLSPLTTTLNYGVLEADGSVDVRLIYDHRVLDGAAVARALGDLEQVLETEICAELTRPPAINAA